MPQRTSSDDVRRAKRELAKVAQDNLSARCKWEIIQSDDVVETIANRADRSDLLVLGAQRATGSQRLFGGFTREIAVRTDCAVIVMSGSS